MTVRDPLDNLVWATRGRRWGFRFLLDGGAQDPLLDYERVFVGLEDEEVCRPGADHVALRFLDPLGRKDSAGRVIPHDFVVRGDLAEGLHTVDDGLARVWSLVAPRYAAIWDSPTPPR